SMDYPLLGYRWKPGDSEWENQMDPKTPGYLADHSVGGAEVFPASAYVELAFAASRSWYGHPTHGVTDLEIRAPLVLDRKHARTVRFKLSPDDGRFTVSSRVRLTDDPWTLNAVGRLTGIVQRSQPEQSDVAASIPRGVKPLTRSAHYQLTGQLGLTYGPAFQGIAEVWPGRMEVLARIQVPESVVEGVDTHILHPTLLDACFQALTGIDTGGLDSRNRRALVPVRFGRVDYFGPESGLAYVRVTVTGGGPRSLVADFQLLDESGFCLAELKECRFRAVILTRGGRDPGVYEWLPLLKPLLDKTLLSPVPDTGELVLRAAAVLREQETSLRRSEHFQRVLPLFDALMTVYAYHTLEVLGAGPKPFELDTLISRCKIDVASKPLLTRLLQMLEEDGLAQMASGAWSLSGAAELPVAEDIWLSLLGDYPAYLSELVIAGRCGSQLPELLRKEIDPGEILVAGRNSSSLGHLYEVSPTYKGVNIAARALLEKIVADWPDNRRLRILEIGGGSGGLTTHLLSVLPAERCDYLFADSDEDALSRAEVEFSHYPFLRLLKFDPQETLEDQPDLAECGFDLVIAANSLHRMDNLTTALGNIERLLARGGVLLILEREPDRFTDMTLGCDPDWWLHSPDTDHPISRLLSAAGWQSPLERAGFQDVSTVIEPCSDSGSGAYLVLAKSPSTSPRKEAAPPSESRCWLILVDPGEPSSALGRCLETQLMSNQQQVITVESGSGFEEVKPDHFLVNLESGEDFSSLFSCLKSRGLVVDEIVHLMGFSQTDDAEISDLTRAREQRCISTLHLVRALTGEDQQSSPRLVLITSGGALMEGGDSSSAICRPSQSLLSGMGRVIMNEHPELGCRLIDVQSSGSPRAVAGLLLPELMSDDGETEVVIYDDARYALRMHQVEHPIDRDEQHQQEVADCPVCLDFVTPGPFKHLYWRAFEPGYLQAQEVEIKPHAVGLNFRDVMYAMGLLSDEAVEKGFSGPSLGMELSGEIIRVGFGVTDYKVGDQVMGFAPACFGTRVVTQSHSVLLKPETWSYEEAATVPTAFFTVYYALEHLARIAPEDRVLIHGAAGGVGIAAIQLARYRGAEVFATAGTQEKRDFLRLMGADHVMDSRSLRFADEIMEITGGEGVDIILNSLAGEAITRNLSVLKPFGRFLELGKRDFYENSRIGLRPFRNNITYFGIDADQLMEERSALTHRLFEEMMILLREGVFRPLPHRVFPAHRIADAFRHMQHSRQIGKIVVSFDDADLTGEVMSGSVMGISLSGDAAYLVTGGLSGFGLKTACWLVDKGARFLVLMGRSGASTPEARECIEKLRTEGVTVKVMAVDVTDPGQLKSGLNEIEQELPPLKGIVHGAMVLEDSLLVNLGADQVRRVIAPKMLGAWNLHWLTREMPLDFFVLYSSVSAWFGNPGQANYVAANGYMESLAAYRKSQGLPALAVAWGAISDVGYLARSQDIKEAVQAKTGGNSLTSEQALAMLEKLLSAGYSVAAVADFDWPVMRRLLPSAGAHKFDTLRQQAEDQGEGDQNRSIHELIENLTAEEIRELVTELLAREVAEILRLPKEKLPLDRPLSDLGMDSLMGMELVLALEDRFAINLPVMALAEGSTITRIAERITHQLVTEDDAKPEAGEEMKHSDHVAAVAVRHDEHEEVTREDLEQIAQDLAVEEKSAAPLVVR
ncbi:MAG: SDR family NAD(P)-dependent oxidoreductase, partial [Gammaproteobacteria bacterium]|nr:SDR family NAD(P)-dependent oxidoreductase [Gammaproteobacteria bacterium]